MKPLIRTRNGRTNLHVWRTGLVYEEQKGAIYRSEWNNILFSRLPQPPEEKNVLYFDIRRALPYADRTFDGVFLLHVIEHLTPQEGELLLREVYRVLKPLGLVRVSTPDLEDICRAYLKCLEGYDREPTEAARIRYEWSVLELLDQFVRTHSGGLMVEYIKNRRYDLSYAKERYRDVFDEFHGRPAQPVAKKTFIQRLRQLTIKSFAEGIHRRVAERLERPYFTPEEKVLRDPYSSGELNRWLYDRLSLELLFKKAGFQKISRKTFSTSDIPEWDRFDFERSNFGDHAIEPSLYMEAAKPGKT